MKNFLIIIFSLLIFGCKRTTISAAEMDPVELKNEILKDGNHQSYVKFFIYQYEKEIDKDFLSIFLKMYHEYNYVDALSKIYLGYIYINNPKTPFMKGNINELFAKIPKSEQEKALHYLEIGKQKSEIECIVYLREYYDFIGATKKSKDLSIYLDKIVEEHKKKVNDSLSKIQYTKE